MAEQEQVKVTKGKLATANEVRMFFAFPDVRTFKLEWDQLNAEERTWYKRMVGEVVHG